jgi:hypothetical protein
MRIYGPQYPSPSLSGIVWAIIIAADLNPLLPPSKGLRVGLPTRVNDDIHPAKIKKINRRDRRAKPFKRQNSRKASSFLRLSILILLCVLRVLCG